MVSAAVRARLTHALRLDLIGPEPDEPQAHEILPIPPSRWYLTGFLAPNAPARRSRTRTSRASWSWPRPACRTGDDDSTRSRRRAARPLSSSIGLSVLVPAGGKTLEVTARWGDYKPLEKDGKPTGEWRRTERTGHGARSAVGADSGEPVSKPRARSDGLEIVTSVRRVRGLERPAGPARRDARGVGVPRQSANARGGAGS